MKRTKITAVLTLTITLILASGAAGIRAFTLQRKQPGTIKKLNIALDINNGGVEIVPSSSKKITADYDSTFYDVKIKNKNNKWVVSVSGKKSKMGKTDYVKLQLPDIKSIMTVHVENGDFCYDLPKNCKNQIYVTAKNGGVRFTSKNHYKNSNISLITQDKDYIIYEKPNYPSYFTKTDNGFEYKNGTEVNKIKITLAGYTSVDFND